MSALILEEIMWKSRLSVGYYVKIKSLQYFTSFFIPQNGTYLKKHVSYIFQKTSNRKMS